MNALAAVLILFGAAQDNAARDRLQKAIDEAKRELAAERERIAKEDAAQEADLAQAKAALTKLTDELFDRTAAQAGRARELEALRTDRTKLRTTRSASLQSWSELHRSASDARVKLADLVEALPPSEARPEQRKKLEEARAALERPAGEPFDLHPLLAACRSLLDEARTTAVFDHPIRNADGVLEDATVLRAGMILHAYKGKQSGRIGEVAAAPSGQGGYRWSESLPKPARAQLLQAFDAAASPGATLQLPIDVTQRLAPERRDSSRSFYEVLESGGPVMIPLLLVGLLTILLTAERVFTLANRTSSSEAQIRAVLDASRAGDYEKASLLAEASRDVRMRAMAAALRARDMDRAAVEEAVKQAVLREMPALERIIPLIGVFAAIAPMLGLLGTVTGMITTFDVIRLFGSGDPGIMAGGISEALVATATGLVVAIPILLIHSWLSSRVDRILADTQVRALELLALLPKTDPEVARA